SEQADFKDECPALLFVFPLQREAELFRVETERALGVFDEEHTSREKIVHDRCLVRHSLVSRSHDLPQRTRRRLHRQLTTKLSRQGRLKEFRLPGETERRPQPLFSLLVLLLPLALDVELLLVAPEFRRAFPLELVAVDRKRVIDLDLVIHELAHGGKRER